MLLRKEKIIRDWRSTFATGTHLFSTALVVTRIWWSLLNQTSSGIHLSPGSPPSGRGEDREINSILSWLIMPSSEIGLEPLKMFPSSPHFSHKSLDLFKMYFHQTNTLRPEIFLAQLYKLAKLLTLCFIAHPLLCRWPSIMEWIALGLDTLHSFQESEQKNLVPEYLFHRGVSLQWRTV